MHAKRQEVLDTEMKKTVIAVMIAVGFSLCACSLPFGAGSGAQPDGGEGAGVSAEQILEEEPLVAPREEDGQYHIGILVYRDYGAADETISGFEEELSRQIGNGRIEFVRMSADGDAGKCAQIATDFANGGFQLIFACGTEAVQNAGAAVRDVPIIGACVSDFLMSEVVSSLDAPGGNISGVSCLGPVDGQIEQLLAVTPWVEQVAILTSGTEVGSRFQESVAAQCLNEKGILWKSYHAPTTDDLLSSMRSAAAECSCIFLPTDSFVASHMEIVREVVLETGAYVFTGDYQMCKGGGLCCRSIDYAKHGRKAAEMAYAILEKDEEISRMTIRNEEEWDDYYNPEIAERLGWYGNGNMLELKVGGTAEEAAEAEAEAESEAPEASGAPDDSESSDEEE